MRSPTSVLSRKQALVTSALVATVGVPLPALCDKPSIKTLLDAQDSKQLLKPQNQGPFVPAETAYPTWFEGEWRAATTFAGYELPAKDIISREALFAEADVPGFKKCSIALFPDVGKEGVRFSMRWFKDSKGVVREDRASNFRSVTRGGLGYDAIERVDYMEDPNNPYGLGSNTGNPNRIKLVFARGLTTNAERIELFLNARESEVPDGRPDLFYTEEAIRQVTFSAGQTRQISGEYAHFISYRKVDNDHISAVVVTACYADPLQCERFFVKLGGNRPLITFAHGMQLTRVA